MVTESFHFYTYVSFQCDFTGPSNSKSECGPCDLLWSMRHYYQMEWKPRLEKYLYIGACSFLLLLGTLRTPHVNMSKTTYAQVIPVTLDDIKPIVRHVNEAVLDQTTVTLLAQTRRIIQRVGHLCFLMEWTAKHCSHAFQFTTNALIQAHISNVLPFTPNENGTITLKIP